MKESLLYDGAHILREFLLSLIVDNPIKLVCIWSQVVGFKLLGLID